MISIRIFELPIFPSYFLFPFFFGISSIVKYFKRFIFASLEIGNKVIRVLEKDELRNTVVKRTNLRTIARLL